MTFDIIPVEFVTKVEFSPTAFFHIATATIYRK